MKKRIYIILVLLFALGCVGGCAPSGTHLSANDPITLTLWHVYGEQADSPMNRLVAEFNETAGKEQGIVINVTLMTNTTQVGQQLLDAQADRPGATDMPDLFFCHSNNAAALGAENVLDWKEYFTEEELSRFVQSFVDDGMIGEQLAIFPVSKSTHLLFVNGAQFDRFAADTGASYDDLTTWDGFFATAAKYYEWSGGKTFCALDYLLRSVELNAMARGGAFYNEEGWYDFESTALKDSWMEFALPLAQGHIAVSDMYSNTQVMTGETVAGLGSSAAILYYNDVVTYPDNTTEPMELRILPLPKTAGGPALMTQAGVGLCAYKTTEAKAEAAAVFARWLTESRRNLEFVVDTGYMPVSIGAFDEIAGYEFEDAGRERLYAALRTMREEYTAVSEPDYMGYYDKVYVLYDGLRELQRGLKERTDSPADIAAETWEMFRTAEQALE